MTTSVAWFFRQKNRNRTSDRSLLTDEDDWGIDEWFIAGNANPSLPFSFLPFPMFYFLTLFSFSFEFPLQIFAPLRLPLQHDDKKCPLPVAESPKLSKWKNQVWLYRYWLDVQVYLASRSPSMLPGCYFSVDFQSVQNDFVYDVAA